MRTLVIILILAAFLQTTIIPVNLVLLTLLLRAYIKTDKVNLYLAFSFGILISFLNHTSLGPSSLIYIILVQLVHLYSKTPLAKNTLLLIPLMFICFLVNDLTISLILLQPIRIDPIILLESLLALPIFIMLRIWEERFIVRPQIKLKI